MFTDDSYCANQDEVFCCHILTEAITQKIQSGQSVLQQVSHQAGSPRHQQWTKVTVFSLHGPQVHPEQDPPPSLACRPQRIAGLHRQGGMVDNVVIAVDPPLWQLL